MYVWELVSCRLRLDGWNIRHGSRPGPSGPVYTVHLERPGLSYEASGPTLTEAYAAAARRVRDEDAGASAGGPHFARWGVAPRS